MPGFNLFSQAELLKCLHNERERGREGEREEGVGRDGGLSPSRSYLEELKPGVSASKVCMEFFLSGHSRMLLLHVKR